MDNTAHDPGKESALLRAIQKHPHEDYPCRSRVHFLNTFKNPGCSCYVKRDDELGFGCAGSKMRKYRSLIAFLKTERCQEVAVIGGASSNNVLGLCQLLIENGIAPVLFLRKSGSSRLTGTALFISLLAQELQTQWISREDWPNVESVAKEHVQKRSKAGRKVFLLPEGASVQEALPGSLSLPLDILRNEKDNHLQFDHIFIDAGTGLTASALLLGYAWIGKSSLVHILLLAEKEERFKESLKKFHRDFEQLLGNRSPLPERYRCYRPSTAASFGSVNTAILREVCDIAGREGFFTDPIYSAKLFKEARSIIVQQQLEGNILLIHSGGALALAGYQERLMHLTQHPSAIP